MRCLDCNNLTSHSKKMALHGYGNCKQRPDYKYMSITRDHQCEKFAQVTAAIALTRSEWAVKVGAA